MAVKKKKAIVVPVQEEFSPSQEFLASLACFLVTFVVFTAAEYALAWILNRIRRKVSKQMEAKVAYIGGLVREGLAAFLLVAWSIEAYNWRTSYGHMAYGVALFLTGLAHSYTDTDANPCSHLFRYRFPSMVYGLL